MQAFVGSTPPFCDNRMVAQIMLYIPKPNQEKSTWLESTWF